MKQSHDDLGRLVSVHAIAPVYVQRAAFVAVLSFLFFLAMMFAFYVLQSGLYFLLSTAFLIVYLLTMLSFLMQRKKAVEVYENGFKSRKSVVLWNEIVRVDDTGEVKLVNGKTISLPQSVVDFGGLLRNLRNKSGH